MGFEPTSANSTSQCFTIKLYLILFFLLSWLIFNLLSIIQFNCTSIRIISYLLCLTYCRFSTSQWQQILSLSRTYHIIKMKRQIYLQQSYCLLYLFLRYLYHYLILTTIKYKSLYSYYIQYYSLIYTLTIHKIFSYLSKTLWAISPMVLL